MKKIILHLPIIAIAMVVMSCSNSESVEAPQNGEATVTFNVTNYEQIDMDEAETRSADITNLNYLTLGIYDATTLELVTDTVTQYKTDDDFGTFSVTLPYGSYKVLVLGYTNTYQPDMTDPTNIVFDNNFVPNLFSNMSDLTVNANTMGAQTIALSRVVAAFRVNFEDPAPEAAKTINVVAKGGSYILNSTTGYADDVVTRTHNVVLSSSSSSVIIYSFLTANEAMMNFTCTAYDANDKALVSHFFENVPMKINQLTVYTGYFFAEGAGESGFSVELAHDFDWENKEDYTFNFSD